MHKMNVILTAVIFSLIHFIGCYSFTGASVPPHLQTIAIPLFDDQSGSGEPNLREILTNKLIEKFRQDNSLAIADKTTADSILEGIIVAMTDQPQVVTAGETVSKSRITVTVKVTYQDMKLKKKVWEKQFSQWADYQISGGAIDREASISTANEKLCEDILLQTVTNW
ncbi:MAG: LptE family protein [Bacteroidota bacterium]|nr:LptE family protein [Bacteroidota bacterium]